MPEAHSFRHQESLLKCHARIHLKLVVFVLEMSSGFPSGIWVLVIDDARFLSQTTIGETHLFRLICL